MFGDWRAASPARAVASALGEVFPWAWHLSHAEQSSFAEELITALWDAAELTIDRNAHEVIAGWRATARIKADPVQYEQALAPTEGDFGPAGPSGKPPPRRLSPHPAAGRPVGGPVRRGAVLPADREPSHPAQAGKRY